jgi:hypothetical protein
MEFGGGDVFFETIDDDVAFLFRFLSSFVRPIGMLRQDIEAEDLKKRKSSVLR